MAARASVLAAGLLLASACGPSDGAAVGARAGHDSGRDDPAIPNDAGAEGGAAPAWSPRRALPIPQQETAVVELGGKVYVLGGLTTGGRVLADVNVYDPATDSWAPGPALPEPMHHVNAAVIGGRIWIAGALRGAAFTPTGKVWMLDPASGAWSPRSAMKPGAERGASFTAAIGELVYVGGGLRGGSVSDFARYNTTADAWEDLPAMPAALDHGAAAAHGGVFYAFGGRSGALSSRVDAFDPATRTWSSRTAMPTARAGFALAVQDGRAILLGGEGNASSPIGMFAEVEVYDLASDRWSTLPPMRTPRHGMGAASVERLVVVPGGGTVEGLAPTDVVEALER